MNFKVGINVVVAGFILTSCASHQYVWRDYDEDLQKYYDHPTERVQILKALEKTIAQGEREKRVAPGLYAEYGYLLVESGETTKGLEFFEKEKNLWSESAFFMDKVIRNFTQKSSKNSSAEVH
jgi:hypothetical protein